ncbi:(2Fe-2S)-binding protein [Geothrix limicola]|uniref:(2Fe-2S)-binding protein n=1 Tax=Geothrix limicola TaxID=2927978 RepID=A0ABQ5QB77_9BACT|nr:2Fe-2S iron-sulfur cluster-binding protein [Geothrix limicola]GLH71716.1 (2Fe-2S)-binding protein [Geothrix limicola]
MPRVIVDGRPVDVAEGALLVAALGLPPVACRSLSGEPRGPLCGMGQCFECRVQLEGREVLACLTPAREGMEVRRG